MALTDEDIEQIYAIIDDALEASDLKEKAMAARYVSERNRLEMEYKRKRRQIKRKARGRRPRGESNPE